MATVNQYVPIGSSAPVSEIAEFRRQFPHIYESLNSGLATQINQLIIRAGGSGAGSGAANLNELTQDLSDLETWTAQIASRPNHKQESNTDELASIIGKMRAEIADINQKIDYQANSIIYSQLVSDVRNISQKLTDLEALCLSILAVR